MIHAFADDSITDALVSCGVVILQESRVAEAEALLVGVKQRFGLSGEAPLHCRIMFAGDARRGTPWGQLSPERIYELVRVLCAELESISERPLVAVIDPYVAPPHQGSPGGPLRPYDVKEIASLAHSSATTILAARYGHDGFRIWSDPDRTKIPWGDGRRRADTTRSPFVDIGPGIEPPRIVSVIEADPKPPLLEVADVYAYTAAQAFSQKGGQRVQRFRDLYRLIDPELIRFEWNQEPKWEDA